jgi:hypothetical protein
VASLIDSEPATQWASASHVRGTVARVGPSHQGISERGKGGPAPMKNGRLLAVPSRRLGERGNLDRHLAQGAVGHTRSRHTSPTLRRQCHRFGILSRNTKSCPLIGISVRNSAEEQTRSSRTLNQLNLETGQKPSPSNFNESCMARRLIGLVQSVRCTMLRGVEVSAPLPRVHAIEVATNGR